VRVKNTKTIAYVVKHLEQKWRIVVEKINERRHPSQRYQFRIYPRQLSFNLNSTHDGWGRDDEVTTLQRIHADLMSPNVLQLDYDVKEVDVTDIFNLSQQQPHIVQVPIQQSVPVQSQTNFISPQQLQQLHQLQQQQLQQQIQQQLQQQIIQQQQQQQFMLQQQQFQQQLQQQLQQPLQALNRGIAPRLTPEESLMLQQLQQIQQQQQQRQAEQQMREQLIQQEQARLLQLQQMLNASNSNRTLPDEAPNLYNAFNQQQQTPQASVPSPTSFSNISLGGDMSNLLMGNTNNIQGLSSQQQLLQHQLNMQMQQQQPNAGLRRTSSGNSNRTPTRTFTFHSPTDFSHKMEKNRRKDDEASVYEGILDTSAQLPRRMQ
jgi:ATP-dependent Lon protease